MMSRLVRFQIAELWTGSAGFKPGEARRRWRDLPALGVGMLAGLLAAGLGGTEPNAPVETSKPLAASAPTANPAAAMPDEKTPKRRRFRGKRPTPMRSDTAAHQLARAWRDVTGREPTLETISVLWAHWAHETGRGKGMVDYNFAGLKGRAPSGASAVWWTTEKSGSTTRKVRCRFRAYVTAEEGARDYVRLLHARFDHAFAAATVGDAKGFVGGLDEDGYFTASHWDYERSVRSLASEFLEGPLAREMAQYLED